MAAAGEDVALWLRRCEELEALEEGEGDPSVLLAEELGLLRQLHSEDVSADFLQRLWKASGSWKTLRQREAVLRALANEHAAAAHYKRNEPGQQGGAAPDLNWELLRQPYVPELPTEVAIAMARAVAASAAAGLKADAGLDPSAAEKYVLEREEEHAGYALWLDPNGNLETIMPAESGVGLQAPTATSQADTCCVEALCKVTCDQSLCNHPRSLCWHCWRKAETTEQHPNEFRDLLAYARITAETAAPLQRAAETALSWPFFEDIASATVDKLKALPAGSGVIVLGGVGVSAVRAARDCAAKVWIWEPRQFLAATARAVVAANDIGSGSIQVVGGALPEVDAAIGDQWSSIRLIVVEGLEMDGLLGFGALKQLRAVKVLRSRRQAASPNPLQVLPSSVAVSARLADARVAKVSGFDFGAFARVSKAFAPFLSALATNATSAVPTALTEEGEAFNIDLEAPEDTAGDNAEQVWDWPDADLHEQTLCLASLAGVAEGAMASAVLTTFSGRLGTEEQKKWGEGIFYVQPIPTPTGGSVLRCFRNSTKIWFEIGAKSSAEASAESLLMPLHGPPFGHAYLQEWYLDMYRDIDRNDFYEEGLRRWVKKYGRETDASGPAGRVMDIGSGTGLLLFFALRAGAANSVGVEVAPNLKRMSEAIFDANVRASNLPKDGGFKIIHNDALRLELPEAERPHCLVTEMMDGSGLGENMIRVILHAKTKLLAKGYESQVVPRKLVIKAALLHIRLPEIGGVNLSPLEAFWGPTRALGCEGEFANLDLDNPEAGACDIVSEVVQVWDVDFAKTPEEIAEACRSHMVDFPLTGEGESITANAVAWWFEAHLDDAAEGEEPPPMLTNVPVRLRKAAGLTFGGGTHWHQAVAVMGPFQCKSGTSISLKAHTDGKKITWTSSEPIALTEAVEKIDALRESWLDAARKSEEQAQRTVWQRQRMAEDVSDAPRVAALQAAAMHVGAQPGLFGVFGGSSVASHILKEWFGAGCSAGF